jgi:uncharacterized membrane protein
MSRKISREEAIALLKKSVVSNPGINLRPGEVCYFASNATGIIAKNQVIKTTYSSFGSSLYSRRFGIGFHDNQGVRNNVRGTVVDTYEGHLYLTSKRIVLVAYKGGFDIPLEKLTSLDCYGDGLMVTSNGKSYIVGLNKVKKMKKIIEASNVVLTTQDNVPPMNQQMPQNQSVPPMNQQMPQNQSVPPMNQQMPQNQSVQQMNPQMPQNQPASGSYGYDNGSYAGANNSYTGTDSPKGKKQPVALWIVFIVCLLIAIFSLTVGYNKLKFFVFFGSIALGCALHLDPLKLRENNKMLPVAATWMICALLAIIGLVLL